MDQGAVSAASVTEGASDMRNAVPDKRGLRQGALLTRRAAARVMLVTAGTLALAACTAIPKPKAPAPTGPAPEAPKSVDPGLPADATRHRIALLVPQTGSNADIGEAIANATTLALLDTKTDRLRITTYNTATGAAQAAQAAIADGNTLILGPLLSEDVGAVAPIARAAKVPVLSFSNDVSVAGNGVFVLGYVPSQSIDRVVRHAKASGMNRFAALVPKSTYGDRASAALKTAVAASGATLVAVESYDRTAAAMTGAARRLANLSGYDAVLIADSGGNAVRVVPMLRGGSGANAKVLGTELWNTDTSVVRSPALHGAWFASVSDGYFEQLAAKYRARYGKSPFRLSSIGYDSVLLTVRVARDWKPGTAFPAQRLLAEDGFGGIDGIFRFNNRGIAERALEVSEVTAQGNRVIAPAPTKW